MGIGWIGWVEPIDFIGELGGGVPAQPPGQFAADDWSTADAGTGGTITISVLELPADGGSLITGIDALIDGVITALGGSTPGLYSVSELANNVPVGAVIRAVNAVGNGPWSDSKEVAPNGDLMAALFTGNAPNVGGWWDIHDSELMFASAANMSSPVEPGADGTDSSIQVILDKGHLKGLSFDAAMALQPEKLTNEDFTDLTGWSTQGGVALETPGVRLTRSGVDAYVSRPCVASRWRASMVELVITENDVTTTTGLQVRLGTAVGGGSNIASIPAGFTGTYRCMTHYNAADTTWLSLLLSEEGRTVVIDRASLKEVPGNPLISDNSAAALPIRWSDDGRHYMRLTIQGMVYIFGHFDIPAGDLWMVMGYQNREADGLTVPLGWHLAQSGGSRILMAAITTGQSSSGSPLCDGNIVPQDLYVDGSHLPDTDTRNEYYNAVGSDLHLNMLRATTTGYAQPGTSTWRLGTATFPYAVQYHPRGRSHQIMILPRSITAQQRQELAAFLMTKMGIV